MAASAAAASEETPEPTTLLLVDPTSTARCLALEAAERGVATIALWSRAPPPPACSALYSTELVALPSVCETADAVQEAAKTSIVVLAGSDDGVQLADALSSYLRVPIANCCDDLPRQSKHTQHRMLSAAGLRACRTATGATWTDEMEAICSTSGSVVVKLDDGTGSEGVRRCGSVGEARSHFEWLMGQQRRDGAERSAAAVQEFLEGAEYVVDTVSCRGVHKVVMLWTYDKRRANGVDFVYFGETPLDAGSPAARVLVPYVCDALCAIGVHTGPCHTEVILAGHDCSPCLVEVNLRCHGGTGLWRPLTERLVGYSQVSATLDACLATRRFDALPPVPPSPLHGAGAFLCLVSFGAGRVVSTPLFATLRGLTSFVDLNPMGVEIGARVEATVDLATLIGMVVLAHPSPDIVASDVATVRALEASGGLLELSSAAEAEEAEAASRPPAGLGAVRRRKIGFG